MEKVTFPLSRQDINQIYKDLMFTPRNEGQTQFFYLMLKYARQRNNRYYIHNSIFITENPIYFEKLVNGGNKRYSLRDLFPNLILVLMLEMQLR